MNVKVCLTGRTQIKSPNELMEVDIQRTLKEIKANMLLTWKILCSIAKKRKGILLR